MKTMGPLLIVFGFFAILFVMGKALQKGEKKRRLAKKEEAERRVFIEHLHPEPTHQGIGFDSALKGGKGQASRGPGLGAYNA